MAVCCAWSDDTQILQAHFCLHRCWCIRFCLFQFVHFNFSTIARRKAKEKKTLKFTMKTYAILHNPQQINAQFSRNQKESDIRACARDAFYSFLRTIFFKTDSFRFIPFLLCDSLVNQLSEEVSWVMKCKEERGSVSQSKSDWNKMHFLLYFAIGLTYFEWCFSVVNCHSSLNKNESPITWFPINSNHLACALRSSTLLQCGN